MQYIEEFGAAKAADPLQFLFIKSEWLMLRRLYRQILNIRARIRSSSRRSFLLRKYFLRTSFLLEKLQMKKMYYTGQLQKSIHLLGISAQELNFSPMEWELLSKGASFVPSVAPSLIESIEHSFQEFQDRFLWRKYWAWRVSNQPASIVFKRMEEFCIKHRAKTSITPFPESWKSRHRSAMQYFADTKALLDTRVSQMQFRQVQSNVTPGALQFLRSLKDHPACLIKKTDKNMGLAIISRTLYLQLCQQALHSMHLRSLSRQEMKSSFIVCQQELRELKGMLSKSLWQRLTPFLHSSVDDWFQYVPVLYGLPKVHKPILKVRPIVAASQLPFKWISGFIGYRINEILQKSPRIQKVLVKDSRSVVAFWNEKQLPPTKTHLWGVTFDVVELYPSLPTDTQALAKISRFLLQEEDVTDARLLTQFLDFLFRYNWFQFSGQFFQQTSGLAMGYPHSPPVANLLMFLLFEHDLDFSSIVLYHRYLDDGVVIFDSTESNVRTILDTWNARIPGISFTWDIFDLEEGMTPLSFLDLQFGVLDRTLRFQTHQKQLNSYLYIPSDSMHPPAVKASLVKTELIRHVRCCSTFEAFAQMRELFWHRLRLRGYSVLWLRRQFNSVQYEDRLQFLSPSPSRESILIFKIRFSFACAALHLSRILNQFLTDDLREQLDLQPRARIIVCFQRYNNLANFVIRARDSRSQLTDT